MLRRFESRRAAEKKRAVSGRRAPIVCLIAVLAGGFYVAPLPQAQACLFFNPICWVEKALDTLKDILGGVAELVSDIIELDPGEFFEDLADIAEDVLICDAGAETTLVELIGGNVAQELFDNCSSSQGIEPEVLAKLETYMRSSFDSVRIHTDCDFPLEREAITFGEHIYFAPGNYRPLWDPTTRGDCATHPCDCREENGVQYDIEGFGILAHELAHVLQYRREGFADFICKYTLECGLGALIPGNSGLSCRFEQEAYVLQALLIEDMRRDGDGIYTCPLGECNDEGNELHFGNVGFHSCIVEINLCGQVAGEEAPDYCDTNDNCPDVSNPGQEDSDGDGRGDACDQCPEGVTPYQDLDNDCVPDDMDNCACDPADVAELSDCTQVEAPPSNFNPRCFVESPCLVASNPDQADFDGDGMGDVCDPDDDNDGLKDVEEEIWGTDPKNPDTDDDGLTDGDEVKVHQTNPLDKDTDDDCLTDGFEVAQGLDPLDADMDDDGAVDGKDVEWLESALAALPPSVFRSTGNRNSISTLLLAAETQLIASQEGAALLLLRALRTRLDGCGTSAEGNDWITDCAVQTAIRELLDLLISNVETC